MLPPACLTHLFKSEAILLAAVPGQDKMGPAEWYVIAVAIATVGLWCANTALSRYLGQMGIVAILPMVAFFGFGILNKVPLASLLLKREYTLLAAVCCPLCHLAAMPVI
jgi:di/tricarboxylate transporter